MSGEIPVLMYHDLSDGPPQPNSLPVPPRAFEAQIAALARLGYRFLSLAEALARKARGLLERSVILTFDDAYRSHVTHALPTLKRYGARATFFVPAGWVGASGHLAWDDVRMLQREGMEIGSHGFSHGWLPDIADDEKLRWEVQGSKEALERELAAPVSFFSYPVGGTDERVAAAVARAGYLAAVVSANRVSARIAERFRIPRIKVQPHDRGLRFLAKASGFYNLMRRRTVLA